MTKNEAITYFGTAAKWARAIDASKAVISRMPEGELSKNFVARTRLAMMEGKAREDAKVNS